MRRRLIPNIFKRPSAPSGQGSFNALITFIQALTAFVKFWSTLHIFSINCFNKNDAYIYQTVGPQKNLYLNFQIFSEYQ